MTAPPHRSRLRELVTRRPLTSFLALAYGLSWLAWLPYVLSSSGLGVLDLRIPAVLGTTQIVGMLPGAYLGPVTAAFLVTAAVEGRPGLRRWVHRLTHWRVGWRWYVAVLAAVPAVLLLATFALPAAWGEVRPVSAVVLVAYLPLLLVQLVTTALAEEPGWRDFALPRLQSRYGPVLGTAVLGLAWGGWHLPLFLTEWGGWPDSSWLNPVEFVAACIPISLVMTWVFNRSGQSVPLVMVLHASVNTVFSLVWAGMFPGLDVHRDSAHVVLLAASVVAAVLLVATRGRLGLDDRQPNERVPAARAAVPTA